MNNRTSCLDPEELVRRYSEGISAYRLAKDHGCSIWSIITRLRAAGVTIRKDGVPTQLGLSGDDLKLFQSLVTGILLGDGSVNKVKKFLRLQQAEKRLGWLQQVKRSFDSMGVRSRIISISPKFDKTIEGRPVQEQPSFLLYTTVCDEFRELRRAWYPNDGVKRIPKDLRLDPVSLTHWMCGDGSRGSPGFTFYTNGFLEEDVDFLILRLQEDLGIEARKGTHVRQGQSIIRIGKVDHARKLADIVRPHMDDSCLYKLEHITV
jgi:hypothetical protein